jgi:predicted Fe-S protein YdhL (DUF1289 family)
MKRSPMKPGTKPLKSHKPMARGEAKLRRVKPKSAKPKRAEREAEDRDLMDMCHRQECYLQVPGIFRHDQETVVPCHSNQSIHGKGERIKAHNRFTVPGCGACHAEIDQGMRFTKAEKFAIWDRAFARWERDRSQMLNKVRKQ